MGLQASRNNDSGGGDDNQGMNQEEGGNNEQQSGRYNLRRRRRNQRDDEEESGEEREQPEGEVEQAPARAPLEPRRHQGGHRAVDILNVLNELYRTGHFQVILGGDRPRRNRAGSTRDGLEAHHVLDSTGRMDRSDFKLSVTEKSGGFDSDRFPYGSVPFSAVPEYRRLTGPEKIQLMHQCLPNKESKLMEIDDKLFCGLHSKDGKVFMTAAQDFRIRLFDTSKVPRFDPVTGTHRFHHIRTVQARDVGWSVLDVRLSTCGRYVAYSSWSDAIHLCTVYDDTTHVPVPLKPDQPQHCGIFSLMFSHDDQEILCGVNNGEMYICSLVNGRSQRIQKTHRDDVNCVAFADESSHILYSGSDDGVIKVWDRRNLSENNPQPCGIFVGHKQGITYLDPHADGRHLLSNGKDQCIKLWDLRRFSPSSGLEEARRAVQENPWDYRYRGNFPVSGRKLSADTSILTYTGHVVTQTLIRARFSPFESTASRYIYTGDSNGYLIIFDALTGEQVRRVRAHTAVVRDVSWHPWRPEIVTSSWDGCQFLWTFDADSAEDEEQKDQTVSTSDSEDDSS